MSLQISRIQTALALAGAGVAWPNMMCAIRDAMLSPVERAMLNSWCGGSPQDALVAGHCAICVAGATALLFAALLVILAPATRRQPHQDAA